MSKNTVRYLLTALLLSTFAFSANNQALAEKKKSFSGHAGYYHPKFYGRRTASGQVLNKHLPTAAHRTLPFGTKVKVKNTRDNRECTVVINDRGPFCNKMVIDVSHAAAEQLGLLRRGTAAVACTVLDD